ncbi:MAG: hypothetical protein LBQ27_06700 [Clostridiales bacterium]|jgi:hypothetical protein|nr:hypothetical protein [Clostridiales bacterium]
MNYDNIKRLNTVVTENSYIENRIGEQNSAVPEAIEHKGMRFRLPRVDMNIIKRLKGKLDIYDAIMIPVGVGILAAFVMLILKVV